MTARKIGFLCGGRQTYRYGGLTTVRPADFQYSPRGNCYSPPPPRPALHRRHLKTSQDRERKEEENRGGRKGLGEGGRTGGREKMREGKLNRVWSEGRGGREEYWEGELE
jgi:hypothetical protein